MSKIFAQQMFNNQQRIGVEDGLPQSYITGITQDKDGFLWVSTLGGLSRYDGKGFKNFEYQASDSTGLASNTIYYLLPQGNNTLSLFYDGILADDFDMRSFRVSHQLKIKVSGTIIHGGSGRYSYNGKTFLRINLSHKGFEKADFKTGKITQYTTTNGLHSNRIISLLQHTDDRIYLLFEDGLQVSNPQGEQFEFFRLPGYPQNNLILEKAESWWRGAKMVIMPDQRLAV